MMEEEMIAGGYRFLSAEDATKAQVDQQKIDYIRTHVNLGSLEAMHTVYEKAITNRIFKTPVGWGFLIELRGKMLALGESEDSIMPIPVLVPFSHAQIPGDYVPKQRIKPAPAPAKKKDFPVVKLMAAVIVALSAMLIALFIIASTSDVDNIINYKRNVTNRYAAWEQDLTEREKAVREKEKELGIAVTDTNTETTPARDAAVTE